LNNERAEARRKKREEKTAKRRKALAARPVKKQRRPASLRGNVTLLQRTMGGLLVELRGMTNHLQQQQEIVNILLECLAKKALGKDTEEDKAVLDDYLDECDQAKKAKAEAEKPPEPVDPEPVQVGESVFDAPPEG
jgi:hypothetical protein